MRYGDTVDRSYSPIILKTGRHRGYDRGYETSLTIRVSGFESLFCQGVVLRNLSGSLKAQLELGKNSLMILKL